jgi:hypothetical protein
LHKLVIIFLSKTKIQPAKIGLVLKKIGFFSYVQIPPVGLSRGLFLAWKNEVDLEPIKQDAHQITCLVFTDNSHQPWMFSFVYAPHQHLLQPGFLEHLSGIGNSFQGSWLLLGDFNSILTTSEKSGGRAYGSQFHRSFEDFVHSSGLIDLGFNGNRFTWSNHRQGIGNIIERLDRGLANGDWVLLYPNSLINHLPTTNSNHCPLLLSLKGSYQNLPKPFRFEAF